jgi:hypothetical protein
MLLDLDVLGDPGGVEVGQTWAQLQIPVVHFAAYGPRISRQIWMCRAHALLRPEDLP